MRFNITYRKILKNIRESVELQQMNPPKAPTVYSYENPPPEAQEIIEEESEDLVNYHCDGLQYDPVRYREATKERPTHRLPDKLVNVRTNHWFGTHNSMEYLDTDELKDTLDSLIQFVDWFIMYKEEAPTTGHVHFHSICVLKKHMLAWKVIEIDPSGTWEPMRGTLRQSFNYIRKDGNKYFEWGSMPGTIVNLLESEEKKARKRNAPTKTEELWKAMVKRAKTGDESIRDEMLYARYRNYFDDILAGSHVDKRFDEDLTFKNLWIYGPPGTGKSRLVWDYAASNGLKVYTKMQNRWWDGYNGQQIVLIEDVGKHMENYSSHMKVWTDRYPFQTEFKGSSRRINAADFYFICTSNYSIDEIFTGVDSEAIKRRFDILEMK